MASDSYRSTLKPEAVKKGKPTGSLAAQMIFSENPKSEKSALNPDWVEWLMGFPPQVDGRSIWRKEPDEIPRLTEITENRAERLKCLGNAVVPAQVYPILKYIADIETGRCYRP